MERAPSGATNDRSNNASQKGTAQGKATIKSPKADRLNYFSTNVESNLAAGQHAANNHMKSNNSELAGPYSLEKSAGSSVYVS